MTEPKITHLGLAAALLVVGCSVFDESLIPTTIAVDPTTLAVSDDCGNAPTLVNLTNDLRSLRPVNDTCHGGDPPANVTCLGPLTGRNFYFSFKSPKQSGADTSLQKWHVHAANTGGNVALYVLNDCAATNSCSDPNNAGIRTNDDEHLSFQVSPDTTYTVVVNMAQGDLCGTAQGPRVLLQHDICGDSVAEHGKACDPAVPSDACVACRAVLGPNLLQGREPNDSPLDANIIPMGTDAFSVSSTVGQIGVADAGATVGIDPYDFFQIQAQAAADRARMVNATLSWPESTEPECGTTGKLAAIYLGDAWFSATNVVHNGSPPTASFQNGQCTLSLDIPFSADTASGTPSLSQYFLRVAAQPGTRVSYTLTVKFAG